MAEVSSRISEIDPRTIVPHKGPTVGTEPDAKTYRGLSPEQNDTAINLRNEHKEAVKQVEEAEEDWVRSRTSMPHIQERSRDDLTNAHNAYDANLWRASQHKQEHLSGYKEQAEMDAKTAAEEAQIVGEEVNLGDQK